MRDVVFVTNHKNLLAKGSPNWIWRKETDISAGVRDAFEGVSHVILNGQNALLFVVNISLVIKSLRSA